MTSRWCSCLKKNTLGVRGLRMARGAIVSLIFLFCGTRHKKGSPSLL